MQSEMLHTSIQSNKHLNGTPKSLSIILYASSMFLQKITAFKNLLFPSNFQTLVIAGRTYEKGQLNCLIACTKVLWLRSYTDMHLTLLSITSMSTKIKKNNQTMMRLCYYLIKKNIKTKRVEMRMIKNENRKNEPLLFLKEQLTILRKKLVKVEISKKLVFFQIWK